MEHLGACDYAEINRRHGLSEDHVQQIMARPESAKADKELKSHGRIAWNLYMDAGAKVDLSVMPRVPLDLPLYP